MTHRYRLLVSGTLLLMALFILGGCGGGSDPVASERVGSKNCTDSCHASTQDITGSPITSVWSGTTHTTDGGVQCEDCHGGGKDHQGTGPIPFPRPRAAQCNACHGLGGFDSTLHANSNPYNGSNLSTFTGPDKFFFQGDASNSGPAEIMGIPEFFPDGVTPVTHAQHIQECSVCHNPNERFTFKNDGTFAKPDPANMPDPPNITCAGCHDAHQPEQKVTIAQRSAPVAYPVFRKYIVNPTGEQSFTADPTTGNESPTATSARLAAIFFQPNGAVLSNGSVDATRVVGTNNELNVERLCASCHTVGKYLYSQLATHQKDIYSQWLNSGHGSRNAPAFAEFSANPGAYTNPHTGTPYPAGTHQVSYPFDMALNSVGATANTTRNAGNNNYACYKCHHGIGSLAWQDNLEGTAGAPVLFGDVTVTCITCHDPHKEASGQTKNTRRPVMITDYSTTSITIQGNVFLDNQPVDLDRTGNATICIFCHQGRESGLTLYATRLAPGKTITGNFFNPHYLGTGAMVWGANAYEYAGKLYSVNTAHQSANCIACHMHSPTTDNRNGGHTWAPNVAACNTADCHGGSLGPVSAKSGSVAPNVDTYRASSNTSNYTGEPGGETLSTAQSIQSLQGKLKALLAAQNPPVYYDDVNYPYFFKTADSASHTAEGNPGGINNFTAWTPATLKAAFNLAFVVKGLPSIGESQAEVPNASAAVHNYKYCIQLLLDSYEDLNGASLAGATRPAGARPATAYGPGQ